MFLLQEGRKCLLHYAFKNDSTKLILPQKLCSKEIKIMSYVYWNSFLGILDSIKIGFSYF